MFRITFLGLLALAAATNYGVPERKPSRLHFPQVKEEEVLTPSDAELSKTVDEVAKVGEELQQMGYGAPPEAVPVPVPEVKPPQDIPAPEVRPPQEAPVTKPPEPKPTTIKYVLNEEAAEAYWKTHVPPKPAETTAMPPTEAPAQEEPMKPVDPYAPPMEPPTEPPMEPPTEPPMEPPTEPPMPEPVNPYEVPAEPVTEPATEPPTEAPLPPEPVTLPYAAPAMEEPAAPVAKPTLPPTTTMKYVLNHEAAKKYWATAKFPTTTTVPPPVPEKPAEPVPNPSEPMVIPELPQDKPAPNPYAPPMEPEAAEPVTEMPAVPVTPEFKPTTMKYVLNEEAAKKYWATAKFEKATVAPVPPPEPMTEAPLPPQDEPAPVNPYAPPADVPMPIEEKPMEEKPAEKAPVEEPVTTPKYVLNEEAAKKYWATAKFPETTAAPVPPAEPMTEAPLPPQDEPAPVNPYAPPADVPMPIEEKPVEKPIEKTPVEEKPVEEAPVEEPVTTPKYVLNEEAAKKYWATAKFPKPTTAAPVVTPEPTTKAAPVEVPAKDEPVHVGYGLPVQPEQPMPIPADEPVSKPMGY